MGQQPAPIPKLPPMPHEPVLERDIEDQQELMKDIAKCLETFAARIEFQTQGTNRQLVALLRQLRDVQMESYNTLQTLKCCFPPK